MEETMEVMDRLRKSFRNSFRSGKKKHSHTTDIVTESQKPHQWQSDEHAVRSGTCVFHVKYLGCVEVFESRGMQICEDALRRLRNSRRRGVKGQLYVTGDGIRVVDDDTKGLIVDQTIEKVSFCAPDRSHERGFSYICRDGTTRRWMCHGFHATKDSGERLSHAVGCAFNICLERKQKRDKESVSAILDANNFQRTGSFRQSSITERLQDPQVAKPSAEPVPVKPVHNPYAVARPHATASLLQRQGSLRGGPLNHASPFKRQLSLRLNSIDDPLLCSLGSKDTQVDPQGSLSLQSSPNDDLDDENNDPKSNNNGIIARNRAQSLDLQAFDDNNKTNFLVNFTNPVATANNNGSELINNNQNNNNSSLTTTNHNGSSSIIAAMCQQLSEGLSMLSAKTIDDGGGGGATAALDDKSTSAATTKTTTTSNVCSSDKDPLFSFSNIDQWISPTSATNQQQKSSSPSTTTSAFTSVIDEMPQMAAPPPPQSLPSLSSTAISSSIITTSTTTTVPISTTSPSSNLNLNNPFLSNVLDANTNTNTTTTTSILESSIVEPSLPTLSATTTTDNQQSESSTSLPVPFKSTNPFLDLSQYVNITTTDAAITTTTKSFNQSSINYGVAAGNLGGDSRSIFDDLASTTTATATTTTETPTVATTTVPGTGLVKAFEVSM